MAITDCMQIGTYEEDYPLYLYEGAVPQGADTVVFSDFEGKMTSDGSMIASLGNAYVEKTNAAPITASYALDPAVLADDSWSVDEAYAGDIIGVFDPGIFSIGDTLCMPKEQFAYEGIPTFAPEHFARVRQVDTMKRKQFVKGITQIAQEGAIQIFQEFNTGMEEIIVGVVGVLQFDVLKYRLENEYNVEVKLEQLPFEYIRWIENPGEVDVARIQGTSDMKRICDLKGNPLLLFVNSWSVGMVLDRNKGLELSEFGKN